MSEATDGISADSGRLTDERRTLREQMLALGADAERNHLVFRRLLERELAVLSAESLPQLLEAVVQGLQASYDLDCVTVVLQDPNHEIRHLLLGDGHPPGAFAGVTFTDSVLTVAPQMQTLARPWLGPYLSPDHQLLFPGTEGLGSVAILPLVRGDRLVGALNFGSADPKRFTRHHASDFLTHLGAIVGFAVENACNRARLVRAGLTDFLTGWHNKRYLTLRMREELARARRQDSAVSLLMIDLDRFKEINDSCGHLGGDAAIRDVAQRIESQVRTSDTAARFGGDEFAVLMPCTNIVEARRLAVRIMHAVGRAAVDVGSGMTRSVTLSIGIAALAPGPADEDLKAHADQLIAEADAALYRAKAAGRNCIECQPSSPGRPGSSKSSAVPARGA